MSTLILKTEDAVNKALAFKLNYSRIDPIPDNLYFYFGKTDAWSNEESPDVPTDSVADDFTTRSTIIGIKKVLSSKIASVVPRYNWQSGGVYAQYDHTDVDLFSKNFYVLNSNNNVYKCISNSGGATSVVEPSGTSTNNISTGDGYTWKFMYNLTSTMINNFLTTSWLPVPTDTQRTSFQIAVEDAATYVTNSPAEGHGKSAVQELGAKYIMVTQTLEQNEGGIFPVNDDFRQLGLWQNPKLLSNGELATGTIYSINDSNSDIDITTGRLLYIDNRRSITRSTEQTETFKLIIEF